MLYPVFFSDQSTLDNFDHGNFFSATNPFISYAPIYTLDNRTNIPSSNISRDYDNNQVLNGDRRSSLTTLVSCLSPSSCSSHTHCYCHNNND